MENVLLDRPRQGWFRPFVGKLVKIYKKVACSKTLNLLRIETSKRHDIKQDPTRIHHNHMSENSELT